MKKLEAKQKEIDAIDAKIADLNEKMKPFRDASNELYTERKKVEKQIFDIQYPPSLWDNLDAKTVLSTPALVLDQRYEKFSRWNSKQKYAKFEGYFPETNKKALRITLKHGVPFEDMWASEIDEYTKAAIKYGGQKSFQLFEDTLSEHGIFSVRVADTGATCMKTVYHNDRVLKECKNLKEAFKWCYDNGITYDKPYRSDND